MDDCRTVRANGAEVRRLRKLKGWNRELLAHEAGCSVGTVSRFEKGEPILVEIAGRIAEALGVVVAAVLAADESDGDEAPDLRVNPQGSGGGVATIPATDCLDAVIEIAEDFDSWTPEKQARFLEGLRLLMGTADEVRVIRRRRGSVKLTVRLTPEQAKKLQQLYADGLLAPLGVARVDQAEPSETDGGAGEDRGEAADDPPDPSSLKGGEVLWVRIVSPAERKGLFAEIIGYSPDDSPQTASGTAPNAYLPRSEVMPEQPKLVPGVRVECAVLRVDKVSGQVWVSQKALRAAKALGRFKVGGVYEGQVGDLTKHPEWTNGKVFIRKANEKDFIVLGYFIKCVFRGCRSELRRLQHVEVEILSAARFQQVYEASRKGSGYDLEAFTVKVLRPVGSTDPPKKAQ